MKWNEIIFGAGINWAICLWMAQLKVIFHPYWGTDECIEWNRHLIAWLLNKKSFGRRRRRPSDVPVMSNNQTNANLIAVLMLYFQMCRRKIQWIKVLMYGFIMKSSHTSFTEFICHTFDILLANKINELISRARPTEREKEGKKKKSKLFLCCCCHPCHISFRLLCVYYLWFGCERNANLMFIWAIKLNVNNSIERVSDWRREKKFYVLNQTNGWVRLSSELKKKKKSIK